MTTSEAPASHNNIPNLEEESAELDGYFSDAPLSPQPSYPPLRSTFETSVVISNLPIAPVSKLEKLTKVVTRLVSKIGTLATSPEDGFTGVHIPIDKEKGTTCGFAFVDYVSGEDATQAVKSLDGFAFDKKHNIHTTPYTRLVELEALREEEFTNPDPPPFVEKPNTSSWLEDPSQRDQFMIRHKGAKLQETAIYWNDGRNEPSLDYDGERQKKGDKSWCDYYVQWSPRGSYLATLHTKGVMLWGGDNYQKLGRFEAHDVESVVFSPCETYFLTSNNRRQDPNAIKIFEISSGKLMRAFPLFPSNFIPEGATESEIQQIPPPPFQWSHDDKYLARMGKDLINIYETPSFKLLDKRSLTTTGIREFMFSPGDNVLAYWAPEHNNSPAHVDLIQLPSRTKLRQKNLFNVTKCAMVWQDEGSFLGVKVTRHTKSKKTQYNNLELFRLEEQGVPVEMLDVKDAVMAFAWEPQGSRFAMIHAENPSSTKVDVSFYDMDKKVESSGNNKGKKKGKKEETTIVKEVNLIETLEGKQCNCLFWSPAGKNIVLASLGDSASGTLEFYDLETKALAIKEHYRANRVHWDPAGRTIATCVSQPIGGGHFKFSMDNGYILWTFQGRQLSQQSFENFYQFQWRPRERLLGKAEIKKVVKDLKKYEKEFDKVDKALSRALSIEKTRGKRELRTKFRERLAVLREFKRQQKEARVVLMDGYDSDDEGNYDTREVSVETIVNTKEEIV